MHPALSSDHLRQIITYTDQQAQNELATEQPVWNALYHSISVLMFDLQLQSGSAVPDRMNAWKSGSKSRIAESTSSSECLDNLMQLLSKLLATCRISWPKGLAPVQAWRAKNSPRSGRIGKTYIPDGGLLIDLRLEILENALVNHFAALLWLQIGT